MGIWRESAAVGSAKTARDMKNSYVVRREEGCWSLAGESPVREIVIAPGSSRDSRAGNQTVEALDGKGC